MEQNNKLSRKTALGITLFGIFGQIAWCIENSFLNLYVYRTVTTKLSVVSAMVAASAVVATLTTIIMGWVTDRVGKRRPFMVYGYIIWGVSVMIFALFTPDNMQNIFHTDRNKAIILASVFIVIADCVMTFFGSTANDAAFNAWVTDNTTVSNRSFSFCACFGSLRFGFCSFRSFRYNRKQIFRLGRKSRREYDGRR